MKLFVFEGKYPEEAVFKSLRTLFPSLPKDEEIICTYDCVIYSLYTRMKEYGDDGDIVKILKEKYIGMKDAPIKEEMEGNQFSEVFLFFDYDLHHNNEMSVEDKDIAIDEMLSFFNNETEKGKLYISFPMAEALFYTKYLEDTNFTEYAVSIEESRKFKQLSSEFCQYGNNLFLCLNVQHQNNNDYSFLKNNWLLMVKQCIKKVNYILCEKKEYPATKIEINQRELFSQINKKYVSNGKIPVLSAFPIFLYDTDKNIGH